MNAEQATVAGGSEPPTVNEFATLGSIFVNPKGTFAAMIDRPRFLVAMIVFVAVLAALSVPIFQSGIIAEETIAKLEAKGAPEAQIAGTQQFFEGPAGMIIGLVSTVVMVPFVMLVSAGLLFFMGNLMLGAKLRYPHYLSASVYGGVVAVVDHAVRTVLTLVKGTTDVRLGVGNLFGDELPYIGKVLDSLTDPLLLWSMAVTAVGVGVYARKGFGFGVLVSIPTLVISLLLSGMR
jgi:hypothetical protein